MNNVNHGRIRQKAQQQIKNYLDATLKVVCWNDDQVSKAYKSFNFGIHEGVVFRTSEEMRRAALDMAKAIVEAAGVDYASVREIRDGAAKVLAKLLVTQECEVGTTSTDILADYSRDIVSFSLSHFNYIGPCEVFDFHDGASKLINKHVKVYPSSEVSKKDDIATAGKNWKLETTDEPWPLEMPGDGFAKVYGTVWDVATSAPADLADQTARWKCEIFLTAVRVGLRPADYCHRARIGDVEPMPFTHTIHYQRGIRYNASLLRSGGSKRIAKYKVDPQFASRFHAGQFQLKLNKLLAPTSRSLGERLSNAMGWAARGRQSEDNAERLLHFFTALESLFSDNNKGAPVVDTIARFSGVVLASKPEWRENIFKELKKLYVLRSELVHRGSRRVHWLNANNLQRTLEDVLYQVLEHADLDQRHDGFLSQLRTASHGGPWPESN